MLRARRAPLPTRIAVLAALPLLGACELAMGHRIEPPERVPALGPLQVSAANPRYFATPDGRVVYLTGAHTWTNLQDAGPSDPPPAFDHVAYLDMLESHGLNFTRLWTWEQSRWTPSLLEEFWYAPPVYERTGPGSALDGGPKFDLTRLNQAYFDRMRARLVEAGERGIYVSVMLFNGWSTEDKEYEENPWPGHPFNRENNVNGIDGDTDADGQGREVHTLGDTTITRLQEAYVRKVIETVNDLDHVMFEISNESHNQSEAWQYHMIEFIKSEDAALGKRHPVGMTAEFRNGQNGDLFASPADWVAPNADGEELDDPPAADGAKVVFADTDHICGVCADRSWVWRTFLRGRNPILMDIWQGDFRTRTGDPKEPGWEQARTNMGYARAYAQRVDLSRMKPRGDLASTGFCLADPDGPAPAYLSYLVDGGEVTIDLSASPGTLRVEWFSPRLGRIKDGYTVEGGAKRTLRSPFPLGDVVVLIH